MFRLKTKQDVLSYSDDSIQTEIWKAVRRNDWIRAIDMDSFSISVKEGIVLLTGHLSRRSNRELIEEIAGSLPGVHTIYNQLIVDTDLSIQVGTSLANDERTRHFIFPVGCAHGWIRLGGIVYRRELQIAAEEIAAQVPSVRGILSRPRVIGEIFETERRPIQPQIQAKVYDYNLQEGVVTQVVIQPRNRLVTHAVVGASGFYDGRFLFYEYLVPVEAMEVVNKESILLKQNGMPLNAFPAFEPAEYSLTPSDWQPPYPYAAGDVRWLREQPKEMANQSSASGLQLQTETVDGAAVERALVEMEKV